MKVVALFLALVSALCIALTLDLYKDNIRLSTSNTDLVWRNVTVDERANLDKPRPLDEVTLLKVSELTGTPFEILVRARKVENGGKGYEFGYRGKSVGAVENFEPEAWQAANWSRRMNMLLWQECLKSKEGQAILEKACAVYAGADQKRAKYYAKALRGK